MPKKPNVTHDDIEEMIGQIPRGMVVTFANIDSPARAQVGKVQNYRKPAGWHRVVFSDGRVKSEEQRRLLEAEGVRFTIDGKVDLSAP